MSTVAEITTFVKYLPENNCWGPSTRTSHLIMRIQKVITNFHLMYDLWDVYSRAKNLDQETRSRNFDTRAKYRISFFFFFFFFFCFLFFIFSFFFYIFFFFFLWPNFTHRVYLLGHNLSQPLQRENMSAVEGKLTTKETPKNI